MTSIEITIQADADELAELSRHKRRQVLGQRAADAVETLVPLPIPDGFRPGRRGPWAGAYTEANLAKAFRDWAELHDGVAPRQADWSAARDPEHRWPRAAAVKEAAHRIARQHGVRTQRWAPHEQSARERYLPVEAGHVLHRNGRDDRGLAEVPYCRECRHGSGCMPADMSPWQFAVEVIGGLTVRTGGDTRSTKNERQRYGRNRQMVTGGIADTGPSASDPAASSIIETLNP